MFPALLKRKYHNGIIWVFEGIQTCQICLRTTIFIWREFLCCHWTILWLLVFLSLCLSLSLMFYPFILTLTSVNVVMWCKFPVNLNKFQLVDSPVMPFLLFGYFMHTFRRRKKRPKNIVFLALVLPSFASSEENVMPYLWNAGTPLISLCWYYLILSHCFLNALIQRFYTFTVTVSL